MKFVWVILFLLWSNFAGAETTAELLDQLKAAAKKEIQASGSLRDSGGELRREQLRSIDVQLGQGPSNASDPNLLQAVESLEVLATTDEVADLCAKLTRQLREEQRKRETALIEELEHGFTSALQAALAANTAQDLDGPMASVQRLVAKAGASSSTNDRLRQLIGACPEISEFLLHLQNYLAGFGHDDLYHRQLPLLLSSSGGGSDFIPRSRFLARLAELEKRRKPAERPPADGPPPSNNAPAPENVEETVAGIIRAANSLDDMDETARKLEALPLTGQAVQTVQAVNGALHDLRTLRRIYVDIKEGRATTVHLGDIIENLSSETEKALSHLRLKLLLFALPPALGLGDADAARPGENSVNYINRITSLARTRGDWTLLGRTMDVAQTLKIETTTDGNERTDLQSFLAGMNQERAGQYALAVGSLEAALKTGSQFIPPEVIGQHLEKIRTDHPEEYEKGVQIALTPVAPTYPGPMFMDPRFRPGGPFAPQAGPSSAPTINVPATGPKETVPADAKK
ncbi:MAG TPA: hypothetical protein VGM54_17715 [Chthoniobacter sp.]|jgi:hypothetical protein